MSDGPVIHHHKLGANGPTWIHLQADNPEVRMALEAQFDDMDLFAIDALLAEETRPRTVEFDDEILIILRGVNLNDNADPEDMISVRILAGPRRIISTQMRQLRAIQDVEARIRIGAGPSSTGEFLSQLVTMLFERMEPVLSHLDETTDDIEERILETADTALRTDIIEVRKRAIMLRRYMAPQRDAINQLRSLEPVWLNAQDKRSLLESLDRITRYVEDLDAVRERAQIVKDELANMLADRLNRNAYILTVVAAIFLPLGFLTGLLGINVGGIPGATNPVAFWIFCGLLVILVGIIGLLFRRLKLF